MVPCRNLAKLLKKLFCVRRQRSEWTAGRGKHANPWCGFGKRVPSQPSQGGGGSSPTSSPCSKSKRTVPSVKNGELKLWWKEWTEKINFPFSPTGQHSRGSSTAELGSDHSGIRPLGILLWSGLGKIQAAAVLCILMQGCIFPDTPFSLFHFCVRQSKRKSSVHIQSKTCRANNSGRRSLIFS